MQRQEGWGAYSFFLEFRLSLASIFLGDFLCMKMCAFRAASWLLGVGSAGFCVDSGCHLARWARDSLREVLHGRHALECVHGGVPRYQCYACAQSTFPAGGDPGDTGGLLARGMSHLVSRNVELEPRNTDLGGVGFWTEKPNNHSPTSHAADVDSFCLTSLTPWRC
ncbi:hypothetical protein K438DRAFT_1893818 [Mycena galopus ATCC 62051]|nr:hypothetical protein K438DRAFT_1893818 [Mycena galopus ATCC 62051]